MEVQGAGVLSVWEGPTSLRVAQVEALFQGGGRVMPEAGHWRTPYYVISYIWNVNSNHTVADLGMPQQMIQNPKQDKGFFSSYFSRLVFDNIR